MAYICRYLQRIIPQGTGTKHCAAISGFRLHSTSLDNDNDTKKVKFGISEIRNYPFIKFMFSQDSYLSHLQKKIRKRFKDQERFDYERFSILGSDLSTAHFVIARGGTVKFVGDETWHDFDSGMVPNHNVDGFSLEAVNISKTKLSSLALDNFIQLDHLKYINASDCEYVDDWFMDKLYLLENTLEFLDISGCKNVTERGLLCLHHLKKLQVLILNNMEHIKELELAVILLQEYFPDLVVLGLDKDIPISSSDTCM